MKQTTVTNKSIALSIIRPIALDPFENFLAVNHDVAWRLNADTNFSSADGQDGDAHLLADNENRFVNVPG